MKTEHPLDKLMVRNQKPSKANKDARKKIEKIFSDYAKAIARADHTKVLK